MKNRRRKASSHWTRLGRSMLPGAFSDAEKRRLRNRVIVCGFLVLGVWLTFFDSHSLIKRLSWHRQHAQLVEENTRLRMEIERLEKEVSKGLSDELVERIAREEYGMRRPGEKVYRVKPSE